MKVSVIVPVYNVEKYLEPCLLSLVSQEFDSFEIIAVNDGSTDKSEAILEKYASEFPRLIKHYTKENGGLSSARNFGIEKAEGEYLAFVDSDDTVPNCFLKKAYGEAEKKGLDVVTFDFSYVYDSKTVPAKSSKSLSKDPVRDFLLSSPMACTRLIKRELLTKKGFTEGIWYEDLDRIPKLVFDTQKFGYLPESLYNYYQRNGSIMKSSNSAKQNDIFTVLSNLHSDFEKDELIFKYKKEIEYLYIEHLLRSGAMRFVFLDNREELFDKALSEINGKFPLWKKNPYLKKSGLKFRTVVFFAEKKNYFALKCLIRLKG